MDFITERLPRSAENHFLSFCEGIRASLSLFLEMRHIIRIPVGESKSIKLSGSHAVPIRVLLVETHQMCRDALVRLISDAAGFQIAASADTGGEAVRICRCSAPDVVVMPMELEDADAMEVTVEILRVSQQTQVVLMQRSRDESVTMRAIQSGALGLVSTRAPASRLMEAIQAVAQGRSYVGPVTLDVVAKRLANMGRIP
jgi:two-component system, NarL family, response regulator DegU